MLLYIFITCQPVNLINDKKFIPIHYRLSFQLFLVRHLDGPIWLCFRQCSSCYLDRNTKLPSTLLPLYDNNKITRRLRNENEDETKTQRTQSFNQYSENEAKIWRQNILNQFNSVSSSCLRSHFVISNEYVTRRSLQHLENTPEIKFKCQENKQLSNTLDLHFKIFQVRTIFLSLKLSQ